jgi:hypothetical protein
VRSLAVLLLILGACDLQPAPKVVPAPTAPAPGTTPPTPEPTLGTPGAPGALLALDAGVAPVPVDASAVSERCVGVGTHVADVLIEEASDPSTKAAFVQDRSRTVRRTAEACTRDTWSDALMDCYLASKTQAAMQACTKPAPR